MKKAKHTWLIFVFATITAIIICFGLSSCGKSLASPIVDTGSVKYYREGTDDFGFNVNVVTNKKIRTSNLFRFRAKMLILLK